MASAGPLTHRLAVFNKRGGIERFLCGLPLEPTGGPCADCGKPPHFQGQADDHPYRPTGGLACPVHGEQP